MERRAAGIVALAVAVLTIVIMSAVVAPPRGGVAIRSIVPVPPAVGSCGDLRGSELIILDCDDPHTVEVTYTWTADAPAAGRPTFGLCADKVRAYVGSPPAQDVGAHELGRWSLPLRYRQVIATGPNGNNIQDWSWQACLAAPMGPAPSLGYRGQVRAMPATGPVSSALRVCYTDPGAALAVVPCTAAHFGEVIATQPVPAAQSASTADAAMTATTTVTSCAAAARSVTGAADPTFHHQLRVTVLSDRLSQIPFGADIGLYYTAQGLNWLVCSLESTSDRRLLDSVAGFDSGPLPFE